MEFYKRNYVEGLFLSSGVIQSADYTMDQLIRVAKSLRTDYKFGGYIHLKMAPGASRELVVEAGKWADRLSANIEMPRQADLDQLAPAKTHIQIEKTMHQIHDRAQEARSDKQTFAAAGQSTQMIVGATEAPDSSILQNLPRFIVHTVCGGFIISAFSPIPHGDSRLPLMSAPLVREHRLYQADWLMRFYGFDSAELTTSDEPNLSLEMDPKLSWALRNRKFFPVDINTASQESLLRVPGLGVRTVKKILKMRRFHRFRLADLGRLQAAVSRAQFFITAADHNPNPLLIDSDRLHKLLNPPGEQLSLFGTGGDGLKRRVVTQTFAVSSFAQWRVIARELLALDVRPDAVSFAGSAQERLFVPERVAAPAAALSFSIPKAFLELASFVGMYRKPEKWQLLYRVLY